MVEHGNTLQQSVIMKTNFFNKREVAEIPKLLVPGERVLAMISGIYTAGTAILCVTSRRVLLVDKKIIRLSIEDMRFDSIKEVTYSHQAVMASIQLFYVGRSQQFQFKSWHRNGLRDLAQLVQQKMFDISDARENRKSQDAVHEQEEVSQQLPKIDVYTKNKEVEEHLNERIARWRHADRFVDILSLSTKAGRQILKFEAYGLTKR